MFSRVVTHSCPDFPPRCIKKRHGVGKCNNSKVLGVLSAFSWKQPKVNSKILLNVPFFLPFGKVGDAASPLLSRVRGTLVQFQPCRCGSTVSSTFAASEFIY